AREGRAGPECRAPRTPSRPFASRAGREEIRSPVAGRPDPRSKSLTWTKARSPPPLGTTEPDPFSSFHSVIRPARRIGVPIGLYRDLPVAGGPRSVPDAALIANRARLPLPPPRRLALDPADRDQNGAGDADGDDEVRRWKVRADLRPQPWAFAGTQSSLSLLLRP